MTRLEKFLNPNSIAIVGASRKEGSLGKKFLETVLRMNFKGKIYPINPKAEQIGGLPVCPDVTSLPEIPDLAIILLSHQYVIESIEALGKFGVKNAVVISAGFKEIGGAGIDREKKLLDTAKKYNITILGPNCMGIFNTDPDVSFNGTFSPTLPNPGHISFISQSGALGVGIIELTAGTDTGFSNFVSTGNKADLNDNDVLEYLQADSNTKVVTMYLESIDQPEQFRKICSKIAAVKPILAVKAGRTQSGLKAASSHTGALANPEHIVDGFLKQCGVIRKDTLKDLFDAARALSLQPLPKGPSVAVVTNAGGPAILASDALENAGLQLAVLSKNTQRKLQKILPEEAAISNPIDMIASADHNVYHDTLEVVLADDNIDAVLLIIVKPPINTTPVKIVNAIESLLHNCSKPIIPVLMAQNDELAGLDQFKKLDLPVYNYPESGAKALGSLWEYHQIQLRFRKSEAVVTTPKMDETLLSGTGSKNHQVPLQNLIDLLETYDIKSTPYYITADESKLHDFLENMHSKIVLKIANEQIIHKTEAGLLKIAIETPDELTKAIRDLTAKALPLLPSGIKPFFLAQKQVQTGIELVLGGKRDPVFGPVIMTGIGGIFIEVLKDVSFRIAPVNAFEAKEMLAELRSQVLLDGFRGQQAIDRDAFGYTIQQFSLLLSEHPEILEMDLNPLMWSSTENQAVVVDVRATVK
jgi:acetyl coenzyme A synthetase (ADP forming)-like protein